MRRLLAAVLLSSLSLTVAASPATPSTDQLFKEWRDFVYSGRSYQHLAPPIPSTDPSFFSFSSGYTVVNSGAVKFDLRASFTKYNDIVLSVGVVDGNSFGQWQTVFTSNSPLNAHDSLNFTAGTELVLRLEVNGQTYYSGYAGLNPDGQYHSVTYYDFIYSGGGNPTNTLVGFEGTFGGGNQYFEDIVITLTNVKQSPLSAIPEPETYAMMLAGLALVGTIARRRKRS